MVPTALTHPWVLSVHRRWCLHSVPSHKIIRMVPLHRKRERTREKKIERKNRRDKERSGWVRERDKQGTDKRERALEKTENREQMKEG